MTMLSWKIFKIFKAKNIYIVKLSPYAEMSQLIISTPVFIIINKLS